MDGDITSSTFWAVQRKTRPRMNGVRSVSLPGRIAAMTNAAASNDVMMSG